MSIIVDILENAREKVTSAIAGMQFQIEPRVVPINTSYEWDGGDALLNFDAQGAGTTELSGNMEDLSNHLIDNPDLAQPPYTITPEVQAYIEGIADARGITVAQAEQDYIRFVSLVDQHDIKLETGRGYGSVSQLRFGQVLGDALDIDPAFASLMSPNGGFTGPGGTSFNIDGDGIIEEFASYYTGVSNEALGYHAPAHDAFGFLKKNFDIGPGYCYAPGATDCPGGPNHNLSGQISGIQYWDQTIDHGPVDALKNAASEVHAEFNEGIEETARERDEAQGEINRELEEAGGEILREAYEGDHLGTASELLEGAGEVLWETGEGAFETSREGVEAGLEVTRETIEGGLDTAAEINDTIKGDGIPYIPGI